MIARLRSRPEFQLAAILPQADRALAFTWWLLLVLRGVLPGLFALAMGGLIGAVSHHSDLTLPLAAVGVIFVLLQVLPPFQRSVGANLGSKTAGLLYERLAVACLRPPGMGHLENPRLVRDLTMARDFDLGMTSPPLSISMDFISGALVEMVAGIVSSLVLFGYRWWAPLVLIAAWLGTQWLLREGGVWRDRNTEEVRAAQHQADYAYRIAVDAPAAKEVRLFGLGRWIVEGFESRLRFLNDLRWKATRLRERPVIWSLLIALAANLLVFWALGRSAVAGDLSLARLVTFATATIATSAIAFGGLSWALDGAAAPVAALRRLEADAPREGALSRSGHRVAAGFPIREIRFRNVTFAYPGAVEPVLSGFDLAIRPGQSLAIVGRNGAGKTTIAKLLCRLYDPQEGAIEVDGVDLRDLDVESWRSRLTAVFQDYVRFELPLRDNVAPGGAPDEAISEALAAAGASKLASLDTILARGYPGGTDLSGGQWQRVALARALCAVREGSGVVLLDEPTAHLDVRGESEIFERLLAATRRATTILISHRFSTVRLADRICVLEAGKVVELGSHDQLMAAGGRYRTMFELQASRFGEGAEGAEDEEEKDLDVLD